MAESKRSVYLQTVDYPNFERTVETPLDATEYEGGPAQLAAADTGDGVRVWGVPEGSQNQNYFDSMEAGDLVLYYNSKRFVGVGYVGETFNDEDAWVAGEFWEDAPATNIYTLTEFSSVEIPYTAVTTIFGYSPNWYPQGMMRVKADRVPKSVAAIKLAVERFHERHH